MNGVNWPDLYANPDMAAERSFQTPTAPIQEPGIPVADAGGTLAPTAPSGLASIYARNPHTARLNMLQSMAGRDMGGRLGQLPGIVATLLAGKQMKKSEAFEAERDKQMAEYAKRKEAFEKIKNDREALDAAFKSTQEMYKTAAQIYANTFSSTNDAGQSSGAADNYINAYKKSHNLPIPESKGFAVWQGGEFSEAVSKEGEWFPSKYNPMSGAIEIWQKGKWGPMGEGFLLKSAWEAQMKAETARIRAEQGGIVRGKERDYFREENGKEILVVAKSPEEAQQEGATHTYIKDTGEWGQPMTRKVYLGRGGGRNTIRESKDKDIESVEAAYKSGKISWNEAAEKLRKLGVKE